MNAIRRDRRRYDYEHLANPRRKARRPRRRCPPHRRTQSPDDPRRPATAAGPGRPASRTGNMKTRLPCTHSPTRTPAPHCCTTSPNQVQPSPTGSASTSSSAPRPEASHWPPPSRWPATSRSRSSANPATSGTKTTNHASRSCSRRRASPTRRRRGLIGYAPDDSNVPLGDGLIDLGADYPGRQQIGDQVPLYRGRIAAGRETDPEDTAGPAGLRL